VIEDYGAVDPRPTIGPSTIAALLNLNIPSVLQVSPLPTTEASTVSPSSLRSLGDRGGSDLNGPRHGNTQDLVDVGSHFNDGSSDDHGDNIDDDLRLQEREDSVQSLEDQLWDVRIEWPENESRYFIPADELCRLVTVDSILCELKRSRIKKSDEELLDISKTIWKIAPRLFAILVCMGKGKCICSFINEGLEDNDLPFVRSEIKTEGHGAGSFKLRSKRALEVPIRCMEKWGRADITNFGRDQWWMLAPIFKESQKPKKKVRHYELEDNCVLPFIEDQERTGQAAAGGYSSVWGVLIHPAHQHLYKSTNPEVPISEHLYFYRSTNREVETKPYDCFKTPPLYQRSRFQIGGRDA